MRLSIVTETQKGYPRIQGVKRNIFITPPNEVGGVGGGGGGWGVGVGGEGWGGGGVGGGGGNTGFTLSVYPSVCL